jgi:CMP-N,N'-diacetyllegionaminic acid synthase
MKKEILAIIPARGGSKGVLRKNIRKLNGVPLIAYTIEAAMKSKYINRVVVSTEDTEIRDVSLIYGAEVPYLRPDEFASDHSPTIDSIVHMVTWLREKEEYIPDFICLLQCTSPFRNYKHIDEALDVMFKSKMEGIISVCEAEVNPYWANIIKDNKLQYFIEGGKSITRRQDLPKIYRINGAIYIIETSKLLLSKTFETENITAYIMSNVDSIDIDTELDFKFAELIINQGDNIK